jgi:PASTA domain
MPVSSEAAVSQEEIPTVPFPSPSLRAGQTDFDASSQREASSQKALPQDAPTKQQVAGSPSLPPVSPSVGQPPDSVTPSRRAAREETKRLGRRFRVPILLLVLLLLILLGGGAYALTRGMGQDAAVSDTQGMATGQGGVAVPDLVGASSVSEAQKMAGESLQVVDGDGVESQKPVGTVLSQDPVAGKMATKGSTISVEVSKGANLPDVRGETQDSAVRILEKAGFKVKEETEVSSAENEGYVTKQDPQGGKKETAEAGTTVTITVGSGPPSQAPEKAKSSPPQPPPPSSPPPPPPPQLQPQPQSQPQPQPEGDVVPDLPGGSQPQPQPQPQPPSPPPTATPPPPPPTPQPPTSTP